MTGSGSTRSRLATTWQRRLEAARPFLLLARTLPAASPVLTALVAVLVVAALAVDLAAILLQGRLVAAVPDAFGGGWGTGAAATLLRQVVLLGAVLGVGSVLDTAREQLGAALGRRVDHHVRVRVLEATTGPAGIAHLEDPAVADALSLARSATSPITPGAAARGLAAVAAARLLLVTPVVLLGGFRWWLPVVVVPAQVWAGRRLRAHVLASVDALLDRTSELRHSWYAADLALTPGAAKELRVFGLAGWLRQRYHRRWRAAIVPVWRARAGNRRHLFPAYLVAAAGDVLALALVVRAAGAGEVGLGRVAVLVSAVATLGRFSSVNQGDVDLLRGVAALPALLEVEAVVAGSGARLPGDRAPDGLPASAVRFEGVTFRYPGTSQLLFDGFDLEVRAGESLAIVGANGAGKTTLIKLLARLYDPTEGRITVDGVDARHLDPAAWQRRVAAIFQDFTRYELTATDNVAFGSLGLAGDEAALRAAAADAGAQELLDRLPGGWATPLSRRVRGGTELSGGEWQRVALARALLAVRGGAGILVLDEPTAHLDVRAEAELYDRFLSLTRGVTSVVISHRFSTVRRADRIVVIEDGRVVEDGDHDALVRAGGTYARMFALQSARFAGTANPGDPGDAGDAREAGDAA